MRAKKSLGQHFLKSERALNAIIDAGNITPGETVLEIGPGTGALTEKLLEAGAEVIAVEKDDELFASLSLKYPEIELIHDDILRFIENSPPAGPGRAGKLKIGNYKVIANIPYNITGAILEKFLSADHQPELMVLLVQKEVAERIMGKRGHGVSTKESILSISVKAYGKPRYVETVKAGSFAPAPKVDSAIIAINDISKEFFLPRHGGASFSEKEFFLLLRAGFKAKRKKLSSNLSAISGKERVKEAFERLKLDENLRAEDVNLETWRKLAENLLP